jgi:nitroimidazol reductase NimA-like FMN-containing flavoprotein (pyridoxamine 5'-phosphate oxidase superfamily)
MASSELLRTDRSRARRLADRARYDREAVDAILDEALVCHVGFAVDGRAWVMPTTYARVGDSVYLHGAAGNFALRTLAGGVEVCVTVTLLDGLVFAKSAFHHSMNYRSVMLFGQATAVTDPAEKTTALLAIVDHMQAGRSAETRRPTDSELRATLVVRLVIDEGSAKVRTGGPIDDPEDNELPYWAGVVPIALVRGVPES